MTDIYFADQPSKAGFAPTAGMSASTLGRVMAVLIEIRPLQASGLAYDAASNLTDAGFTSVEMVKVMLGIEAAFDIMIPQDMITPENFSTAHSIAAMIDRI